MRFLFFIVANALLFIRPSEFVADLYAVELYRYAILACLLISLPVVLEQFLVRFPGVPPIAGCVLGLFPAVLLSNLLGGGSDNLVDNAIEFFKIVVYYLLLLALVTSTDRLRRFLYWTSVFTAVLALIAIVRYHADIAMPAPPTQEETSADPAAKKNKMHGTYVVDRIRDPQTGQEIVVPRMCGTGIFNDPNDLALAIVCVLPLCLFWVTDPARRFCRPLWLAVILLGGYAIFLTHSRGGFLALAAGLAVFLYVRFGARYLLLLGMVLFPVLLLAFAGRMTSFSTDDGTGQSRIQLWSDYLVAFQMAPLFGNGMNNYATYSRLVAHNAFIHSYAELGVIGGTLFLGAFYFAMHGLYLLRRWPGQVEAGPADPELRRLHPYLLAMVASYTVGILFLSLCYMVPTYTILGVATVYQRLHARQTSIVPAQWTRFVLPRLAGVSFMFLFVSYTFVRLFVHWK